MGTPAWQPLPYFDPEATEPPISERATARAHHRAIMALRWRNLEARAEDRKLGRLPYGWHDWMGCPRDTYNSPGCTCDTICKNEQHPSEIRQRERDMRARLNAPTARAPETPGMCVQWVQSIDTPTHQTTITPHARSLVDRSPANQLVPPQGDESDQGCVREDGSAPASRSGGRWKIRSKKRGRHLSIPERRFARRRWIYQQARAGFGRILPRLFWFSRRSKPVASSTGQ